MTFQPSELINQIHAIPDHPHRAKVTLAYAQSLDGSIATRSGETLKLSNQESIGLTHALRAIHDGILVGIGTILADNPALTNRLSGSSQPRPLILDSNLRTPHDSRVFDHPLPPLIACAPDAPEQDEKRLSASGAMIVKVKRTNDDLLDLSEFLKLCKDRGLNRIMLEGGAEVITSALAANLVDFLVITISPRIIGGYRAPNRNVSPSSYLSAPNWANLEGDGLIWGELSRERK